MHGRVHDRRGSGKKVAEASPRESPRAARAGCPYLFPWHTRREALIRRSAFLEDRDRNQNFEAAAGLPRG